MFKPEGASPLQWQELCLLPPAAPASPLQDGPRFSLFPCGSSRAQETFMQWDQCRRFYNFLMADNMKKIILSHR